jgi:flagellar hook assembly protein FlgD
MTNVKLEIFNLKGQLVWKNEIPNQSANRYRYFWDGKNLNGNNCTSGIYFFRLTTNKSNYIAKMILMK